MVAAPSPFDDRLESERTRTQAPQAVVGVITFIDTSRAASRVTISLSRVHIVVLHYWLGANITA